MIAPPSVFLLKLNCAFLYSTTFTVIVAFFLL